MKKIALIFLILMLCICVIRTSGGLYQEWSTMEFLRYIEHCLDDVSFIESYQTLRSVADNFNKIAAELDWYRSVSVNPVQVITSYIIQFGSFLINSILFIFSIISVFINLLVTALNNLISLFGVLFYILFGSPAPPLVP